MLIEAGRAAVCGKPIAHSLSPVIHNAGYAAAGLDDWEYTRFECAESELAGLVAGLGPEWAGLSLTMPLKEVALDVAATATATAAAIGAANTLVRQADGSWHADNTDVTGMVRALRAAGVGGDGIPGGAVLGEGEGESSGGAAVPGVTVLGGGGTARAALAAARQLGASTVTVVTRRPEARDELRPVADVLGLRLNGVDWADALDTLGADVVISTVPKGAADHLVADHPAADRQAADHSAGAGGRWRAGGVLFDAIYDPWPTPLAASAAAAGLRIVSGLDLLLAQALGQFEQFTGVSPAPEAAMRAALMAAAARRNA